MTVEEINEKFVFAEERFRRIFDNSHLAILLFDAEGYIIDINDATTKLLGIAHKEFKKYFEVNLFKVPNLTTQDQAKLRRGESLQLSLNLDIRKLLPKNKIITPIIQDLQNKFFLIFYFPPSIFYIQCWIFKCYNKNDNSLSSNGKRLKNIKKKKNRFIFLLLLF